MEQILLSLDKLGFATRTQLQQIHDLGSTRNALDVLKRMGEYLQVKRHAPRNNVNVYYLNQKGRELIGSEKERKYSLETEHFLMRNDMYIYYGFPDDFQIERDVAFQSGLAKKVIRPDARFSKDGTIYFLEVDRTQNMTTNKKKIATYAELSPLITIQYKKCPIIIFYTSIAARKDTIEKLCRAAKLNVEVKTPQEIR
ncbi:replication-relaxation family protein [Heyndrickxia acidiproducens]|uniref:replication-relaxation family protein n=1 Tax=Heyndrickxia acidiproducens TaxID=1121084 RepID=UPI000377D0DC|nr:replication-relaxation family protein [Heyndrickxia acidiproducens]